MAGRISVPMRRWLQLVAIALLSFLAFGCKVLEGNPLRPGWVQHPPRRQGITSFVGHGNDINAFNARLAALEDILAQLSGTLGEDAGSQAYRSLSTTGQIPEYSLSVVREFSSGQDVWILAEARTQTIDSLRTELQKRKIEQNGVIKDLLKEVDGAYRNNQDGAAVIKLLDAIFVCATQPNSYERQKLVDLASSYMKAIRLSLSRKNPSVAQVVVKVRRKQLFLDPKVKDAAILATFDAEDVWGKERSDSLLFGSGSQGQFLFVPYSVAIKDRGTVVFSLDIAQQMDRLRDVLDETSYKQLESAWKGSEVSFSYAKVSKYSGERMLVGVGECGPFAKEEVEAYLSSWLEEKGVSSFPVSWKEEEREAGLSRLASLHPESPYLLSMEISEQKGREIGDFPLMVVSGQIQLWKLKDQSLVDQSGVITLVEETEEEAFREIMQVVTDRFSEYL